MKKTLILIYLCFSVFLNAYSYIRISVTKSAGRGLDGYEFVTENFMRDPANPGNCFFWLGCTGNARVQCQFNNLEPFNTSGCQWIICNSGDVEDPYNTLLNIIWEQVASGATSGNIVPSGMTITSDGLNNEPIFVQYNLNSSSSLNTETLTLTIYSINEAKELGLNF